MVLRPLELGMSTTAKADLMRGRSRSRSREPVSESSPACSHLCDAACGVDRQQQSGPPRLITPGKHISKNISLEISSCQKPARKRSHYSYNLINTQPCSDTVNLARCPTTTTPTTTTTHGPTQQGTTSAHPKANSPKTSPATTATTPSTNNPPPPTPGN